MRESGWLGLRRVFRLPFSRDRLHADVDTELEFHIRGRAEEFIALGMSRDDAEREARWRFGDYRRIEGEVAQLDRASHRRRSLIEHVEELAADLRYTCRSLVRQPVFAAIVIGTLTLGIGATTAIFHVVDRTLLHPLPYPNPDRVVYLGWRWTKGEAGSLSPSKFVFWHAQSHVFSGLATFSAFEAVTDEDGSILKGLHISQDYLAVVGGRPQIGRPFTESDFVPGAPSVTILSHALWASRFGADRAVVGRSIHLDGRPYVIVGVMPPSFEVAEAPESQLLVPLVFTPDQLADGANSYMVIGRLRARATEAQADADMALVWARYRAADPDVIDKTDRGAEILSHQHLFVGTPLSSVLWILFGATLFVLLLACANVANLMLARALSRQREFAIRMALGAGRRRLVRQVILETLVLGFISAALATAAGLATVRGLVALAKGGLLRQSQLHLDSHAVVYTTLIALLVSLIVGTAVAVLATRVGLTSGLAGRSGALGGRHRRLRNALVATESAIAMLLLAGAGLLISSFARVSGVNPGFVRDGIITERVTHVPTGYDSVGTVWRFEEHVLEQLRATPGITNAAAASTLPLERGWNLPMTVDGRPEETEGAVEWRSISPSYFQTFGIPVLVGRGISDADGPGTPLVVVVSQSFARQYWPGQSPIGRRILLGRYKGKLLGPQFGEPAREIIGVVPDLRDVALDQTRARHTMWVPQAQAPSGLVGVPAFVVRAADAHVAATALRGVIAAVEPRMGVAEVSSMGDVVSTSLSQRRFSTVLMGIFALLALSLTCIGIYGVVSYSVTQRVPEIGLRMALGAQPRRVLSLVVGQGMWPVATGLGVGLAGALVLSRLLAGMLYGVGPRDPASLATVAAALLAVALLASYFPARRASRIDPLAALRVD